MRAGESSTHEIGGALGRAADDHALVPSCCHSPIGKRGSPARAAGMSQDTGGPSCSEPARAALPRAKDGNSLASTIGAALATGQRGLRPSQGLQHRSAALAELESEERAALADAGAPERPTRTPAGPKRRQRHTPRYGASRGIPDRRNQSYHGDAVLLAPLQRARRPSRHRAPRHHRGALARELVERSLRSRQAPGVVARHETHASSGPAPERGRGLERSARTWRRPRPLAAVTAAHVGMTGAACATPRGSPSAQSTPAQHVGRFVAEGRRLRRQEQPDACGPPPR